MIAIWMRRFTITFLDIWKILVIGLPMLSACTLSRIKGPNEADLYATVQPPKIKIERKNSKAGYLNVVTHEFPPYSYSNPDGSIGGLTTEKVHETLKDLEFPHTIQTYPWARAYDMALNESGTLIYPITFTAERSGKFKWIYVLSPANVHVYALNKRTDLHAENLDELRRHRLGIIEGYQDGEYLISKGFTIGEQLDVSTDARVWLQKFFNQRFDYLIAEDNFLMNILPRYGYDPNEIKAVLEIPELNRPLCLAASPEMPDNMVDKLRKEFNRRYGEIDTPWEE